MLGILGWCILIYIYLRSNKQIRFYIRYVTAITLCIGFILMIMLT